MNRTTRYEQRGRNPPRNSVPDHARVLDAIAASDAAATGAMRALVDPAAADTRNAMED